MGVSRKKSTDSEYGASDNDDIPMLPHVPPINGHAQTTYSDMSSLIQPINGNGNGNGNTGNGDSLQTKQAEMYELVSTVSYAFRMTCMYMPNNAPYLRDFTYAQVRLPDNNDNIIFLI